MKACSIALILILVTPLALAAQERPANAEGYHEFPIYYSGVEETAVMKVTVAEIAFAHGGEEESRVRDFYWYSPAPQVVTLGIPRHALEGMEQVAFSLRGLCGYHLIRNYGSWETSVVVVGKAGDCTTKDIPDHTLPGPAPKCITSSSWVPGDAGENDQKDAAVESLLAQIGIADDVIEALCTGPCPKGEACLASKITSDDEDDVKKETQNDPDAAGEKQYKVTINKASKNGWVGQVYCDCLKTTNKS